MATPQHPRLTLRAATPADAQLCGRICFDAFASISQRHGFPPDVPAPEAAVGLLSMLFSSPGFYSVVAEFEGRIVGSNCLDERAIIAGIGPITIDPTAQNLGIGRQLMQAVMDRAIGRGAPGIRLVQAAFHGRSLSLYTNLGFDVREPLSCMQGRTLQRNVPGCAVRPAQASDIPQCNAVARKIHGFDRGMELTQAVEQGTASVVERDGNVTGYATSLAFFGHALAETNPDLQALIASADSFQGPGILVFAQPLALAMVPGEQLADRSTYDVDEHRAVQ